MILLIAAPAIAVASIAMTLAIRAQMHRRELWLRRWWDNRPRQNGASDE